ncbi:molybdenum cofactor sulfurase 2 [Periplaneta americana]|uniref:molybdenum cofactor sulfurase 2 n=1 Tax=Periplaneta americana TaxID=6978 RepID=UPI0037E6FCDF
MYSKEQEDKITKEFSRLGGICYLDHVGATLYAESQIEAVARDLCETVYGNPHSLSTSSRYCTDVIDQIRYRVLQHFNTDPDTYSVIFTSGATQALKLVAESFDWRGGTFVYLQDNHTSVLGMRELAAHSGAAVHCLSHCDAFQYLHQRTQGITQACGGNSLFVYPAQSNFSGVKYPLSWVSQVQKGLLGGESTHWFCLLDAASFVSTSPLDLALVQPDFVCLSFYKMFGYPTGLGALLVRNSSAHVLQKHYFGGGTVLMSLSSQREHFLRPALSDRFEDGTLPFLSIVALRHGFDTLQQLPGGMKGVSDHTHALAKRLFHALLMLHHSNGAPATVLYCDSDYESACTQGGVVNFNMLRRSGEFVGYVEVLNMANLHGIHLRTGCFCNPGACQRHLGLSDHDVRNQFQAGHVCGDEHDLVNGQPTGSVRVSFGYMSTRHDVDCLVDMLTHCFVHEPPVHKLPVWWPAFQQECATKLENHVTPASSPRPRSSTPCNGSTVPSILPDCRVPCTLTHMFLYPVKSCAAMPVDSWFLGSKGFLYDREWMVVTPAGVCLTQKQDTRLCLIQPHICLKSRILTLTFPDSPPMSIPLDVSQNHKVDASLCQSKVCGDRVQGWDCGDDVASWLSNALGRPGLRLIRHWDSDCRISKVKKKDERQKVALSLSNQAQFLLINSSSVEWLSDHINQEESDCQKESLLKRFRSNLVVQSSQPFEENSWSQLQIGDARFHCEGPCTRCQMVCIDQTTGKKTREPLRTLAAMLHGKMKFGVYLSLLTTDRIKISVGDYVSVTYPSNGDMP